MNKMINECDKMLPLIKDLQIIKNSNELKWFNNSEENSKENEAIISAGEVNTEKRLNNSPDIKISKKRSSNHIFNAHSHSSFSKIKVISSIKKEYTNEYLESLIKEGARIFRIDGCSFTHKDYPELVEKIKKIFEKMNEIPTLIFDLKGPLPTVSRIRDYNRTNNYNSIKLRKGQVIKFRNEAYKMEGTSCKNDKNSKNINNHHCSGIFINSDGVIYLDKKIGHIVELDDIITISDSKASLKVIGLESDIGLITCEVIIEGLISCQSKVSLRDKDIIHAMQIPLITAKDLIDIAYLTELGINIICCLAENENDIKDIKDLIPDSHLEKLQIIARIETDEGVNNFDSILNKCDGVIISRGLIINNITNNSLISLIAQSSEVFTPNAAIKASSKNIFGNLKPLNSNLSCNSFTGNNYANNLSSSDLFSLENYIIEKCKLGRKLILMQSSFNENLLAELSTIEYAINKNFDGLILTEEITKFKFDSIKSFKSIKDAIIQYESAIYADISPNNNFLNKFMSKNFNLILPSSINYLFQTVVKASYDMKIKLLILFTDEFKKARELSIYQPYSTIIYPSNKENDFQSASIVKGVLPFYYHNSNNKIFENKSENNSENSSLNLDNSNISKCSYCSHLSDESIKLYKSIYQKSLTKIIIQNLKAKGVLNFKESALLNFENKILIVNAFEGSKLKFRNGMYITNI